MSNRKQPHSNRTSAIISRQGYYYMNGKAKQYHKSHRFSFSFSFVGKQPVLEKSSRFGRYGTLVRYKGNYPEYKAIVFSYPKALLIWIKHPKGTKTTEQLIEARKLAWACAETIAKKHRLANLRAKRTGYSEHTVEDKALDRAIRPLAIKEPEFLKERCGITINKTSHKGKLEHTDREHKPGKLRAKDRVMHLEDVLYGKTATKEDIKRLERTLTASLEMQQQSIEAIGALNATISELTGSIKELMLGSVKPPEVPKDGMYG